MEALDLSPYVPIDRRHSLFTGVPLPDRTLGAALFADISGFTPLAAALAAELGRARGAEELLNYLNPLHEALISQVHAYHGSVIGFVGDAITCWFDGGPSSDLRRASRRGLACALAMQALMPRFAQVTTSKGTKLAISIKVAVAAGPARRFLVGSPQQLYFEALAGATMERMSAAERQAQKDEVLASQEVADSLGQELTAAAWRREPDSGRSFAVVQALSAPPAPDPWPELPPGALGVEQLRPWVIPAVYERLLSSGSFMAELRPTTPLFVKFGGIDYDGDDGAGDKLDAYIRWVQEVLARQAGTLIQLTIGDKGSFLYASFGAPIAHEDDAQRAAAAALELRDLPTRLRAAGPVQIGISRGLSWTGACGGRADCAYGVISDAVNVAARLMARAAPGQILASQDVAEASARQYRYNALGEISLKGKSEPLAVSELVARQANSARRLAALFADPLVGRQAELEQIHSYREAARQGQGQVVRIEGSAGVGKSHLAAALAQQAASQGWRVLWGNCQRITQDTAYEPWRQIFKDLIGFTHAASRRGAPQNLSGLTDWALRAPLLGDLLGRPIPDSEMTASLEPRLRQQALTALVIDIVQAWAGHNPLLVLLDDVHWLDEASAGLTLAVARAIGRLPAMLVVVHRPPQPGERPHLPALGRLPHYHRLSLDELDAADTAALAGRRLQGELSPLVRALIVAQGHGNPFFTEELAEALREAGHIQRGKDGKWALSQPTFDALLDSNCLVKAEGEWQLSDNLPLCATTLDIPSSVHAAVLARLDRLPEAYKLTLKVASVIGRAFSLELLQAIHPAGPGATRLRQDIEAARQRDLVRVDVGAPEPAYLFKHNITHEVAYGTLLFAQRQQLHAQAAEWYERSYGEGIDPQQMGLDSALAPHYAVLAHHWRSAGKDERERVYAGLAAQQATRRYANESALCYFSRAMELTPERESESYYRLLLGREAVNDVMGLREAQAQDLAALASLAEALQDKGRQAVVHLRQAAYARSLDHYPAALQAARQAVSHAEQAGDWLTRTRALHEWGRILWKQSDYQSARDRLELALELARAGQNAEEEANSLYDLGTILYEQADYAAARARYEQAQAIYQAAGHRPGSLQCALMFGAIHYKAGEYTAAQAHYEQALALARSIGWLYSEAFILASLGDNHFDLGDYAGARRYHEQALAISREIGQQEGEIASLDTLGLVSTMLGDWAVAMAYGRQALAIERDIEDRYSQGYTLNHLGLAWVGSGDVEAARRAFDEALSVRRELALAPQALDDLAGLARAALAEGDLSQAQGCAGEMLAWLAANPPDGVEFPVLVYLTCYRVLQAAAGGDPSLLPRARSVLEDGHALLQARAGRIQDTALREQFLYNVPFNRELLAARDRTQI